MPVIEEIPEIVRTAVTLLPALARVPLLGRIIIALNKVPHNDQQALEQMQFEFDKKKAQRKKLRDDNSRYVIKVSEAMLCVDKNFDQATVIWDFVKSIASLVSGGSTQATDNLRNQILQCMLEKRLRQDTPRVLRTERGYQRPRKGHGKGHRA